LNNDDYENKNIYSKKQTMPFDILMIRFFLHDNQYENKFFLYEYFPDELFLDYTMFDYPYILNILIKIVNAKKNSIYILQ